ncbi:VanZ family protein [Microbacterium esteraromaticum]|uniref:VanZ family protein n=1 Tax=Microbacterium esteraromaticum TaxID=57043 RepID=A0A7D7WAX3_9MICO|nr:VanZ family protein [Microbacterium esteraromaticum]QMU97398.1 VanZ family protein [Microbacterium esteraromaticum]
MARQAPAQRSARRGVLVALFGVCLVGAAAIVFLPIGWQLNRFVVWLYYAGRGIGVPPFVTIGTYDIALNLLLFATPVALASLLWPRVKWWVWVLAGAAGSTCVELVQLVGLDRDASVWDIVANTAGAVIGVGVAAGARSLASRLSRRTRRRTVTRSMTDGS